MNEELKVGRNWSRIVLTIINQNFFLFNSQQHTRMHLFLSSNSKILWCNACFNWTNKTWENYIIIISLVSTFSKIWENIVKYLYKNSLFDHSTIYIYSSTKTTATNYMEDQLSGVDVGQISVSIHIDYSSLWYCKLQRFIIEIKCKCL